ncbi:MAG: hypothetical protein ACREJ3_15690 [Polyangiaceae bacterium]
MRSSARRRIEGLALSVLLSVASACTHSIPDPRLAALAYARAAARGDAGALYAMTTEASRREISEAQFERTLATERAELAELGAAVTLPDARITATARLRFHDGEEAALDLSHGRYEVTSAGTLPGGGRTPEEALDQLRRILARRSYPGMMRILSQRTRSEIERYIQSIVDGLSQPGDRTIQVVGETAVIPLPGGHRVQLSRENGVWKIDDLD